MNIDDLWYGNLAIHRAAEETDENGEELRIISGVASTGKIDRANSIVDQQSLKKAARKYAASNGKMYYNHNWAWGIGRKKSLESDGEKLNFKGILGRDLQLLVRAGAMGFSVSTLSLNDLWNSIKQGITSSLSIGFLADAQDGEKDEKTGKMSPTILTVTDLLEVSVVSIPANADAELTIGKAMDDVAFNIFLETSGEKSRIQDALSELLEGRDLWGFDEDANAASAAGHGDGAVQHDWTQVWEEMGKCLLPQRISPLSKQK